MSDIVTKISFDIDTASLNASKKAMRSLSDDINEQVKLQEEYADRTKQTASEMAKATNEASQSAGKAGKKLNSTLDDLTSAGGGIGKLERGLGGIATLSQGIDVDTILSAGDGLFELAEGLSTLPNLLGNLATKAGLAGVALAGAIALFSAVQAEAEKNAERISGQIKSLQDVNVFKASGGTEDEAKKIIADAKALRDATKATLDSTLEAYEQATSGLLGAVSKVISPEEERVLSDIADLQKTYTEADARLKAYEALLAEGGLATDGLADSVLNYSEQVKNSILIEAEASQRTSEDNRARLEEINLQSEAITAQIEILKSATTQTDETASKILELEGELNALGNEAEITSRYTNQTTKDIEKANEERVASEKKANEERAKALEDLNKKIVEIAQKRADFEEDLQTELRDSQSDASRKLRQDLQSLDKKSRAETQKFILTAQADEAKNAREHARNLEKIQKDAQRQREDLARNLDFAGLFDLESNVNNQLGDAQSEYDAQRQERQIAFDTQLGDLRLSLFDERKARYSAYRDELADISRQSERKARDQQNAFARELRDAQSHYGQLAGITQKGLADIVATAKKAFGVAVNNGGVSGGVSSPREAFNKYPTVGGGVNTSSVVNRAGDRITNVPAINITVNESFDADRTNRAILDTLGYVFRIAPDGQW